MEKDQRIKESTLNCPSKRLRRRLWVVLGGYRWRRSMLVSQCRARLPIIFYHFGDSSTHQNYINLVYNLYLVQFKSHTRSFWCFRWRFLNLYTSYTDKIPTSLSLSLQTKYLNPCFICSRYKGGSKGLGAPNFSKTSENHI
jgi:hypothetical protein